MLPHLESGGTLANPRLAKDCAGLVVAALNSSKANVTKEATELMDLFKIGLKSNTGLTALIEPTFLAHVCSSLFHTPAQVLPSYAQLDATQRASVTSLEIVEGVTAAPLPFLGVKSIPRAILQNEVHLYSLQLTSAGPGITRKSLSGSWRLQAGWTEGVTLPYSFGVATGHIPSERWELFDSSDDDSYEEQDAPVVAPPPRRLESAPRPAPLKTAPSGGGKRRVPPPPPPDATPAPSPAAAPSPAPTDAVPPPSDVIRPPVEARPPRDVVPPPTDAVRPPTDVAPPTDHIPPPTTALPDIASMPPLDVILPPKEARPPARPVLEKKQATSEAPKKVPIAPRTMAHQNSVPPSNSQATHENLRRAQSTPVKKMPGKVAGFSSSHRSAPRWT